MVEVEEGRRQFIGLLDIKFMKRCLVMTTKAIIVDSICSKPSGPGLSRLQLQWLHVSISWGISLLSSYATPDCEVRSVVRLSLNSRDGNTLLLPNTMSKQARSHSNPIRRFRTIVVERLRAGVPPEFLQSTPPFIHHRWLVVMGFIWLSGLRGF